MQRRDLPVTLDELLDARPLLRIQRRVLALVGGAILLEGFDIQTLGLCAPAILKDWHLARESLGPAMAAALVGMAVGASIGGQFGDRFGRRPVLVISIFQFGLCTLLTAAARNLTDIFVLRMLAGLAFGAALSNATALVAEWFVPSRSLKAVGSVIIGTPVGGMLGAALCAWLIPLGGWRVAFLAAGGLTLLLTVCLALWLPESIRYAIRSGSQSKLAPLLQSYDPQIRLDQLLKESDTEVGEQKGALRMIWRPEWRRATLGLGLAFLANLAVSYALFGWAPVLLTTLDFPPNLALRGALLLNGFGALAAAIGLVAAQGSAGQQFVLFYTSIGVLAIMLLTTLLLSVTHEQTLASIHWLILVGLTLVGVGTLGSQAGLYGLAAAAYPTDCRSSGIGVAGACGRLGGVLSSLAGGAVLSSTHGPIKFLCALGVCFLLGGIGVSIVSRDRRLAASPP